MLLLLDSILPYLTRATTDLYSPQWLTGQIETYTTLRGALDYLDSKSEKARTTFQKLVTWVFAFMILVGIWISVTIDWFSELVQF